MLYVIEEPLGDRPDDFASEEDYEEWRDHSDNYCCVKTLMRTCMHPDFKVRFDHTSAIDIIDELKILFIEQVRVMKFECLDEFLSTMIVRDIVPGYPEDSDKATSTKLPRSLVRYLYKAGQQARLPQRSEPEGLDPSRSRSEKTSLSPSFPHQPP